MNHTKGPWKLEADTSITGWPSWRIHSETISDIANLTFMNHDDRDTYGKANARLIAAAPDLLAALENLAEKSDLILSEINSFDSGWYYQFQAAVQQARQALAKATGDHQANHEEGAR